MSGITCNDPAEGTRTNVVENSAIFSRPLFFMHYGALSVRVGSLLPISIAPKLIQGGQPSHDMSEEWIR